MSLPHPNHLQLLILALAGVFVVLLFVSRRLAASYGRTVVLLGACTIMLLPFAWLICSAFKDAAVMNDYTFLPPPKVLAAQKDQANPKKYISPETVNTKNFDELFAQKQTIQGPISFWRYVFNSLFLASAATSISLVFCSMGGYALAKYRFRGQGVLITFMLASMTIPGVVLLAPNTKIIWELGWMDSFRALLVPGAVSVFGVFLFRQAIIAIPNDLIEAGRMDGCGEFKIYLTLVMPLVRPMTGAFCLISFLGAWNAFIGPNVFLQSQRKLPLAVVLNQYLGEYTQQYGVFLAGTLLAIIPPAILFFALQREFISGLTSGAVKQ